MAKVSVIIPNYNHAGYLLQRIDSVLNQTYRDFEVVILDDCSTDNSRDIIELYRGHEKVKAVIYNEVNSGNTFKQWDKGISLAKGEYVWMAESDDWCENNLLETLVHGLEENASCVLAYCQSYCVTGDNNIKFQSNHTRLAECVDGQEFIKKYILPRNPIFNAGMAVWKREVYDKISKDFISYRLVGDYYFWIKISMNGNVFISGKLLNYFRTHENNVSVNSFKNGLVYKEQIPLLKHLAEQNIIDETGYSETLKLLYLSFCSYKKSIPKKNIAAIRKVFANYSMTNKSFWVFSVQKDIELFLKRILKIS